MDMLAEFLKENVEIDEQAEAFAQRMMQRSQMAMRASRTTISKRKEALESGKTVEPAPVEAGGAGGQTAAQAAKGPRVVKKTRFKI